MFTTVGGVYTCRIASQIVSDDENQNFVIGGNHGGANTDASVGAIEIAATSNIPFIIPQLFERFPNVFRLTVLPSGLSRIQSNALRFAGNLELVIVNSNPLQTIQTNAFLGANALRTLDLGNNQIMNVHEGSFNGLSNLRDLMLENNRISRLPQNILQPLKNVESIHFSDNRIETLENGLFYGLRQVREINFVRNRINEVGRNVLDGLDGLEVFNVFRNRCANNIWVIGGSISVDTIRNGLNSCFVNFDALRRLRVEIRGKATISDDYDNEILSF